VYLRKRGGIAGVGGDISRAPERVGDLSFKEGYSERQEGGRGKKGIIRFSR